MLILLYMCKEKILIKVYQLTEKKGKNTHKMNLLDLEILFSIYQTESILWIGRGNYDSAIIEFTEAVRLNPQFLDAQRALDTIAQKRP